MTQYNKSKACTQARLGHVMLRCYSMDFATRQESTTIYKQPMPQARPTSRMASMMHVFTAVACPHNTSSVCRRDVTNDTLQNKLPNPKILWTILRQQRVLKMTATPPPTETPKKITDVSIYRTDGPPTNKFDDATADRVMTEHDASSSFAPVSVWKWELDACMHLWRKELHRGNQLQGWLPYH